MIEVLNCYQKIINNYLESLYLQLINITANSEDAILVIYKIFEKMFIINNECISYLSFRHKLIKYIKHHLKINYAFDKEEIKYVIDERLYLFNFNIFNYFNDLDNKIMIFLLIYGYELSKVAILIKNTEEFVMERFWTIINWMKIYFNSVIKPILIDK